MGCSGTVTFDRETNGRSPMSYNILNAQFAGNDSFVTNITTVGVYDPTSTVLFRLYSDLIWCDGTTTVPLDMRISTIGCLHEDRFDKKFEKGQYLLWGICAFVFPHTSLFTVIIWRVLWNRPLKPLQDKHEMEINDVLVLLGLCVELLQYLSLGPELNFATLEVFKYVYISSFSFGSFHVLWIVVASARIL